jgi:serine/threonine-protein kinase
MLGSYRVERLLGRGGMGAVFLAYDTTLHRQVAVKVIAHSPDSANVDTRVLREARNAAALNHPHICTILEVGHAAAVSFIAMEYVAGRSLRDVIDRGALPLPDVLRFGMQAADALAYAHANGVIHRDFKAANVIVDDDNRLRVVDFGLAHRDDAATPNMTTMSSLVPPGVAAGTPYAMAPEQIRGEPADARTDVWALGVLLYEMGAGRAPFSAATVPELYSAVLANAPTPLPNSVPAGLRMVIERCLQKEPGGRYQTASEARSALESISTGTAGATIWAYRVRRSPGWALIAALLVIAAIAVGADLGGLREWRLGRTAGPSIKLAVLPFQNLTGDPDQEYFSDGLTDEMIMQLGQLQPARLSVIARTSSMRYKRRDVPMDQIARELGVGYILEGSARREGNRIRINATLVDVSNQTQRWSETFDRELSNILGLQSDIASGVARALALRLLPGQQNRLASARPVNPEAYEAYLKGRVHWQTLAPTEIDTAMKYFELAVEKDPNYAAPYLGMGTVYGLRCTSGRMRCTEALPKWKQLVLRAQELDPDLAQVRSHLAAIAYYVDWDWAAADREFKQAIAQDAADPDTRMWYANYLLNVAGRIDEGLAQARRAVDLDPQNALYQARLGLALIDGHHDDEAIAVLQGVVKANPNMRQAQGNLVWALAVKGMYREALAHMAQNQPSNPEIAAAGRESDALVGFRRAARLRPDGMVRQAQTSYVDPGGIGAAYARAYEASLALDWLEKAYDDHEVVMVDLKARTFEILHGEPRYDALLRRMKLTN